ncbi:hypothetical protein [Amphibacillus cookii]|uniref:hypothetical protein n=1 Tax=Amphibacillus cookii TaxID=767787 RepID=UPI00195A1D82|nr:hypothetical protein [Amphibacillus cookii]MBM7540324.1 hypothetical protein [Amphibacillus cookii]
MHFTKKMEPFIQAVHQVLSVSEVRQWARETGFVQRENKLMPEDFLSICAFLQKTVGAEGLSKLCATITRLSGTDISKQALHQRSNEKGVAFLKGIFLQLAERQELAPMCIDLAKSAIEDEKGQPLHDISSLRALMKNIYQNVYRHGRKDLRYQHKSPFDILNLTYERTFKAV